MAVPITLLIKILVIGLLGFVALNWLTYFYLYILPDLLVVLIFLVLSFLIIYPIYFLYTYPDYFPNIYNNIKLYILNKPRRTLWKIEFNLHMETRDLPWYTCDFGPPPPPEWPEKDYYDRSSRILSLSWLYIKQCIWKLFDIPYGQFEEQIKERRKIEKENLQKKKLEAKLNNQKNKIAIWQSIKNWYNGGKIDEQINPEFVINGQQYQYDQNGMISPYHFNPNTEMTSAYQYNVAIPPMFPYQNYNMLSMIPYQNIPYHERPGTNGPYQYSQYQYNQNQYNQNQYNQYQYNPVPGMIPTTFAQQTYQPFAPYPPTPPGDTFNHAQYTNLHPAFQRSSAPSPGQSTPSGICTCNTQCQVHPIRFTLEQETILPRGTIVIPDNQSQIPQFPRDPSFYQNDSNSNSGSSSSWFNIDWEAQKNRFYNSLFYEHAISR